MNSQLWWHVARASGITAWAMSAAAILWGLALSGRTMGRRVKAPWLLDLHRFLGTLTLVFVGVHLGGLVADNYVHFGVADLFVPFASGWRTGAVAWGIVAFYVLVAVEVTSWLMRRIPKRVWRAVHLSSLLMYVMGTIHLLRAGTDAGNLVLQWSVVATSLAVVFFVVYRVVGPAKRRANRVASTGARAGATRGVRGAVTETATPRPRTVELARLQRTANPVDPERDGSIRGRETQAAKTA
ncbi:MAG TPA: ferric reductase-like transmembrane domain-containing protein [Acidimicrobiales bacterium]|jgi:DMSO/TMAO reductase YedYZ heme-binding membrane subunit|nr:ferric reductase-like transmembrane domain-containing protein [Acidimicrobiales bacterium]